jgi:hypothetical protein
MMKSFRINLLIINLFASSLACSLLPVWDIPIKPQTPTFELGDLYHGELRFITDRPRPLKSEPIQPTVVGQPAITMMVTGI